MEYKICPICDQKMTKPHYCDHCRQRIKTPLTINVDYYLNERHPDTEHDCSYHDYNDPAYNMPSQQTAWQPDRQIKPNQPRRRQVIPNVPRRAQSGIPGQMSMPFGQKKTYPAASGAPAPSSSASRTSGHKTAPIIALIVIFIIAASLMSVFSFIYSAMKDIMSGDFALSRYEITDLWDTGGDYEPAAEYESWELDDADVIAAEVNCSSYGHFQVTEDEIADDLLAFLAEMGYSATSDDTFTSNTEDSYGYTSFNRYTSFYFDNRGSLEILSDTATDQLHSVNISWTGADETIRIAEKITSILRANDDWSLSESDTAAWLDDLKDRLPKLEYEDVTPEDLRHSVYVFVSSYESDGYYISFDRWRD